MIVKNPTPDEISVIIKGKTYVVEAEGELSLPAEIAIHWRDRVHNFLELEAEESDTVVPAAEEEEVEEEESEEEESEETEETEGEPSEEEAPVEEETEETDAAETEKEAGAE